MSTPMAIAQAALLLGAGGRDASARIDHAVGLTDLLKIGELVPRGGRLWHNPRAWTSPMLAVASQLLSGRFCDPANGPAAPPVLLDELIE